MSKPKVYVSRTLPEDLAGPLDEVADVRCWGGDTRCPADVLKKEVADVEAVIGTDPWTPELMECAPKLRIIANIGVGYDNVNIPTATKRGIVVTNTPDVLTDTTADLAFALLMAAARRIAEADRFVRAGKWSMLGGAATFLGTDIHHATLGIIGLGRIGATVARRGLGFDMKILYFDVYRRKDLEEKFGYKYVDMDTLLAESDFVSVHMPLLPETRGMMGRAQFEKMKKTAILVNAARGPVVNQNDLIEALQSGAIAGAGLDVFEKEPMPESPLFAMDNVVMAPHIGSATHATRHAMVALAVKNTISVLTGGLPLTCVNSEAMR